MAQGRPPSPFDDYTNIITIVKQSGERSEGIKSIVVSSKISTANAIIPIVEGDQIERTTSNGMFERYQVIQADFIEGWFDAPAVYELKVRKDISTYKQSIVR